MTLLLVLIVIRNGPLPGVTCSVSIGVGETMGDISYITTTIIPIMTVFITIAFIIVRRC